MFGVGVGDTIIKKKFNRIVMDNMTCSITSNISCESQVFVEKVLIF